MRHNLQTIRETLEKSNSALETLEEIGRCEKKLRKILEASKTQKIYEYSRYACMLDGEPYIKLKEILGIS